MKEFKFFAKVVPPRMSAGLIKLKDIFNRNKIFLFIWSEYPQDDVSEIEEFRGDILTFYTYVQRLNVRNITIYEIYKRQRGYVSSSLTYGNHFNYNPFISRKATLTIKYKPNNERF